MSQLDPSIILQAGKGITPLESPMQAFGQALQLKQLMNQTQLQDLSMQAQQQAMQRAAQTRQAVAQSGGDLDKAAKAAYDAGDWETGDKLSTAAKSQAQAKAALQKSYLESNDLEQKQLRGMIESVGASAHSVAAIKDPAQRAQAWSQALQDQAQQFLPGPNDSPKMQQVKASRIQQINTEMQAVQSMQDPTQLDQLLQKHINDAKTHADWLEEAKNNRPTGFHPAIGPDGKPGVFQTTANGEVRQIPGLKPVPAAAIVLNNQMQNPTGPAVPGQFDPDPARPWRANTNFQALASKNGTMASDVDAALNNDYKFGGSRGIQYDRQVQHAAQQIDPNWRQGNYDLKQKMLADPQVVATNAALLHLRDFMDDYNQLSPRTQSQLLNKPINAWTSLVTGNSPDAAILARLQTTAMSVAGEYGKALGGSDAVMSEHERQALFDPNRTKGQLTGVTGAVGTLLQRTINSKENITRRTAPNSQPLTLLDPDAVEAAKYLGLDYSPGGKARGKGGAPQPAIPGLTNLHSNGTQTIGWNGKDWVDTKTGQVVK